MVPEADLEDVLLFAVWLKDEERWDRLALVLCLCQDDKVACVGEGGFGSHESLQVRRASGSSGTNAQMFYYNRPKLSG